MKKYIASLIVIVDYVSLFSGCQQNKEDTVIQTTLGNLPKFINLPATLTEVKWQTEQLGGDNWSLTAMLKFTKADFDKIVSQSSKHETQRKRNSLARIFHKSPRIRVIVAKQFGRSSEKA